MDEDGETVKLAQILDMLRTVLMSRGSGPHLRRYWLIRLDEFYGIYMLTMGDVIKR
ncbi:hypothetical protein GGI24_002872, partial [Coemansia furcata]